jgi:hypothetical protein
MDSRKIKGKDQRFSALISVLLRDQAQQNKNHPAFLSEARWFVLSRFSG